MLTVRTAGAESNATVGKAQRITALDFTKGALVLFMVLYHWINYFIGPQWPYYPYLRFLTPSFIFISGFMISHVYLSKYDVRESRLVKRLVTRGLKLIIIFVVLNIARDCVLGLISAHGVDFGLLHPGNLAAILLTGYSTGKVAAFYILVPIAYLLIVSGLLMISQRVFRRTFQVFCVFLFVLLAILELGGIRNQNLQILAIGMLGVLVGFMRMETINRVIRRPFLLTVLYVLYNASIAIWNVPYPLEIVGTCLTVSIVYLVGTIDWTLSKIQQEIVLLGKYSLFGYIAQIAILQVLVAGTARISPGYGILSLSFVAAFALTVISVELVDRIRMRVARIDGLYRAVFN